MRILMIQHSEWSRPYGGSRVQVELADELRRLGHHVQNYSQEDAFAGGLDNGGPGGAPISTTSRCEPAASSVAIARDST